MTDRRNFLKKTMLGLELIGLFCLGGVKWVWAGIKKEILPQGTKETELTGRDPAELDTRHLSVTPVDRFDTMGQTEYKVDLTAWRLEVTGALQKNLSLNYREIREKPAFEKKVLLICPGVFSYVGLWKGFSLLKLLHDAGLKSGASKIEILGPKDRTFRKKEVFTLEELENDRVFLAIGVNGQALPERHGYPLRVVAENRYGDDWVKYVTEIKVS